MTDSEAPVLDIIIPNYNTAEHLARCLGSLRQQEGAPQLTVYVVDNASTDGSVALVRSSYPEVRLIVTDHNGGFAYAVNQALRRVLAERAGQRFYVLLLNSDTELPPASLAQMVTFMKEHPHVGASGPKLIMGNGQVDLAGRRSFPSPAVAFYRLSGLSLLFPRSRRFGRYNLTYLDPDEVAEVDSVCMAFMLVRGEVAEQVGLLDETFFMYGEDLDWAYRIKECGWQIYYNPRVQVHHWKRAASRKEPRLTLHAFYQAMRIFHRKHYARRYPWPVNAAIEVGISLREGLAVARQALRRKEAAG